MRRRTYLSRLLIAGAVSVLALRSFAEGIPEPDLVMYGAVLNVRSNANLRLGYGTLTWVFQPLGGGPAITATATLTNINNLFSYILHIPCETPVPGYSASSNTIQLTAAGITFNRAYVTWNNTNLVSFAQPAQTNTSFFSADRGRIERLDLDVSSPLIMDANGLPVDWELSYFGRTGIDPNADPDRDGMSNFAEYLAGTDPTDPGSDLRFTEIHSLASGIQLKWLSASYEKYALQRSAKPSGSYLDIVTGIAATAPTNTWVDASATGPGPYYYRLRLDNALSVPTPSPLKFVSIRSDPLGGIRVDWLSSSNQIYALQRSSNLNTGLADLVTGILATPPVNSYRDASATGPGPYFYRLRLDNGSVAAPLKFVSVQRDPLGGVDLGWLSARDQSYTLQRCSNLKAGFTNLLTNIAATPPTNSLRDSTATGAGPYFYRLRLEQ